MKIILLHLDTQNLMSTAKLQTKTKLDLHVIQLKKKLAIWDINLIILNL
jgi:hypothetical protein